MDKVHNILKWFKILTIWFCVLITGIFMYSKYESFNYEKGRQAEINLQIEEEVEKQAELNKQLSYNLSDSFVEKIAREQLELVKQDEIIFINIDE